MKKIKIILCLLTLLVSANFCNAQPGFDDEVEDTPVDGGVLSLSLLAGAFGAGKLFKKQVNDENGSLD